MYHYLLKKISYYLLFLAFSIPVLGFISLIIQSENIQSENNQRENTVKLEQESRVTQEIIYLDNFPVKEGRLSSRYGMRKDPFNGKWKMHQGLDIKAKRGSSVYPVGKGKVIFTGRKPGFGKIIEIQHGRTIVSRYAHLKKSLVKINQIVEKKDIIGQVGNTGRSTGPHLHLEIAINNKNIDPKIFMIGGLASK